jgi:hypothetical protein
MYRNYKCDLNFDLKGVSSRGLQFLQQIVCKKPQARPSAERALEDEVFLKLELDENNSNVHVLSRKIRKAPSL